MIAVNGITLNLFLANGFFMPWAAFEIVSLPKIYQHKGLRRAQPASKKCQWVRQILHCCLQKRNCIKGRDGGKFWLLILLCEDPSQLEYPELAILTGCKICSNSLLLCLPTSLSLENTNLNWAERQRGRDEKEKRHPNFSFSEDDLAFSLGLGGLRKDPHCDRQSFPWCPGYSFLPLKSRGRMGGGNTEEITHSTLQLPQQPYQPLFWQLFSQDGVELSSKTCLSHTSIWSQALTKQKGPTEQTSVQKLPVHSQGSLLLTLLILYPSFSVSPLWSCP